jgi:hypothetical protein
MVLMDTRTVGHRRQIAFFYTVFENASTSGNSAGQEPRRVRGGALLLEQMRPRSLWEPFFKKLDEGVIGDECARVEG